MSTAIGLDIGAVSIKAVVAMDARTGAAASSGPVEGLRRLQAQDATVLLVTRSRRTRGRPLEAAREALEELLAAFPDLAVDGLMFTGSGSRLVAEALGAPTCNEFQACVRAIDRLHPHVRTVFELGGETSRFIRVEPDPASGTLGIVDYGTNGDCAAGTGAFLDQQAARLKFAVEDIGAIVEKAGRAAQIAGRCSVFAKSDMIHAQQKGFQPAEVLRGLCNAVAVNFRSAVVKGRTPVAPVALLGGVAANSAVVRSLREVFELADGELFVPPAAEALPAAGAALAALAAIESSACQEVRETRGSSLRSGFCAGLTLREVIARLSAATARDGQGFPRTRPLTLERVRLLRDRVRPFAFPTDGRRVDAYLGLDIGSVGTKLVLIDGQGEVIHSIFTRTEGRPIEVVTRCLRELEEAVGWGVQVRGVGSTGSGRELIGELVGADSINDEITCHKTGAVFVGDRLLGRRPDTIFEIGGQDSKYISIQAEGIKGSRDQGIKGNSTQVSPTCQNRGQEPLSPRSLDPSIPSSESIVVDFAMNEACAAGTGSFLEERAAELGVAIKDEFSRLALASQAPIRLGERCTVFMERDVNTCMQRGAAREDVIAGLAYSIAYNYINRVVRGRPVGQTVFFQGGTAHNDAVASAFSAVCDREIIVPPHNAVLGAIGAALLAREKVQRTGVKTRFRGYDLAQVDYGVREFTCRGCGNQCAVQEFTVQGEKTFWGDKCSDRYRKRARTERQPVIPDLIALRHELLFADSRTEPERKRGVPAAPVIGIPLAMYTWDLLPLWHRFFRDCGFEVVLSDETNRPTVRQGLDAVVAEPCFPIIVAHGHVAQLVEKQVDYIWLPNIISASERYPNVESHVCPWGATLPFVVRQAPSLRRWAGRILCPTLSFQRGAGVIRKDLVRVARDLGVPRKQAERAFAAGQAALAEFRARYAEAGAAALDTLLRTGEPGMVLVGRPYNIHDAGVSLSTARKLRELYGVNILPIDALPLAGIDVADINENMYWAYGQKILAASKLVAEHPNLHIIYITNFKCGPDSFLKGYIRPASGKPFLTLQFDGHSNDAGTMTRCEAYLDSKGILRWWRTCPTRSADTLLPGEPSTSPRCATPAPG